MRGLVERTRLAAVEVAGNGGSVTDTGDELRSDGETENDFMTDNDDDFESNHGRWEMEVARVYEQTLVQLGVSLDTSGMGGIG